MTENEIIEKSPDGTVKRVRFKPAGAVATQQIIELINRKITPFAISELERELPSVSRDMIRKVLRQLRNQNKIVT
ncbi:MAG: hypothetical protein JXR42_06335 [Gammaproteobacteria bacterium]|nr:hypothetical protein [Gammaproteobacteria bacterium]